MKSDTKCVIEFETRLREAIQAAGSIGLTTHVNPDGDGLCACLALKRILHCQGYEADIIMDDLDLLRYEFLQVLDNVIIDAETRHYDLVIVIDLHDTERLANRLHLIQTARTTVVIDHHEVEDDMMPCVFSWVDTSAVCTGWMIYTLFKSELDALPVLDREYVAKCLYTTLLNDTNNFVNSNTDRHTFELAAATVDYGVKPAELSRVFLDSRSVQETRLMGQVLSTLETRDGGKIAFMDSSLQMLEENGLGPEATSNLTRLIQDLKDVDTAVYFREESAGQYRISLRSKTVNVHDIALKYGGGGHLRASGCNLSGSLAEVKNVILDEIRQAAKLA
jgi:bifunctional oligoribonuclease and PAP phosphatase NrnA